LFNVLERKFVLFGQVFWPQDFHLFVLAMISFIVFIILFTVVYGRIFCGWICPQTIFMEGVFRKIEYWIEGDWTNQKKLRNDPWTTEKIIKKGSKHAIFFFISFLIANTFLAYIIGIENLIEIITDNPAEHMVGLASITVFSFAFYFVFSRLREQVCTTICPYGRLQGVMLDKNSIVVAYDYVRGESRAKFKKGETRLEAGKGDCIDCKQCVHVCPTGIDIRNGTQLECINCTLCIDACDHMMDGVGLPKGLIRYASEDMIQTGRPFRFTTRILAYTAVLALLVGITSFLLVSRSEVETLILRTPGSTYTRLDDGTYQNLYNFKIINKTNKDLNIRLESPDPDFRLQLVGEMQVVKAQSVGEGALFLFYPGDKIKHLKTEVEIKVMDGERIVETIETNFLGPVKK
jgi:cytochrome c oxidase accessory protein FixG